MNRKTLCDKCVHKEVCTYKINYLKMAKKLEDSFYSIDQDARNFATFRDPDCKFMMPMDVNNAKPLYSLTNIKMC